MSPYVCAANEGDSCECTGTAYYGKKYLYETGMPGSGTELTFDEMITINNGNDYITQASRRRASHAPRSRARTVDAPFQAMVLPVRARVAGRRRIDRVQQQRLRRRPSQQLLQVLLVRSVS